MMVLLLPRAKLGRSECDGRLVAGMGVEQFPAA